MHRFLSNISRTAARSRKCGDITLKYCSCHLSTIQITPAKLPSSTVSNYLPHNKFCTRAGGVTEEFVREDHSAIEDTTEEYVSEEDIQFLSNGDAELERKLRVIILEADVMRQDGKCVPSVKFIKRQHWQELLTMNTRTGRCKFLTYLFKTQKKIENETYKKTQQRLQRESQPKPEFPDDGKIRYHLGGNNMFLRFYDSTMNFMYNNKLIQAMQFGQKLIIDCGFHSHMNRKENTNCAKQLMLLFADNRFHDDPFDLHFCNLQKDNRLHETLQNFIPPMYDAEFPLNLHETSYLNIFPKDKLVYLTPHCREEMTDYDHDTIYIIGAIVDKASNDPLTLAKAKQEGIRMAKLPLDRHLLWGSGSNKSLTLNQVISILLDIKHSGDWAHSLRHVPRRKLFQRDEFQSTRAPARLEPPLNNDIPVSQQLLQSARRSNRYEGEDVDRRRTRPAPLHMDSWKPNRSYEDAPKKELKVNVKNVLESTDR